MWRLWSLAASVALLAACFSEPPAATPSGCDAGTIGCACEPGEVCRSSELVCRDSYCIPTNCEPGTMYCECDAGMCEGSLVCQDGAVCLPPSDNGDTTEGPPSTTDASGTTNLTTTEPGTSATSAMSVDTGAPPPFCEAVPDAMFCADFDDGMLVGWSPPALNGGGTIDVIDDAISPPSPPSALRVHVPFSDGESGGQLAASFPGPTPFAGTGRAAVRFGPECFDGEGAPERRVMAFSFYAPGGGFVSGVRIETTAQGGTLYQWGAATSVLPLPDLVVTDTWMLVELSIDVMSGTANVRVDDDAWSMELAPMPQDIVPYLTIGPYSQSNPLDCAIWFDDVAVLP